MNVIFWNTNKNNINEIIKKLIIEYDCDILVMAEYNDNIDILVNDLYVEGYYYKYIKKIACEKIDILMKTNIDYSIGIEDNRYTSGNIIRNNLNFKLFSVHYPDKRNSKERNQENISRLLKNEIDQFEDVIIVGDFNANPFEPAIVEASCLHALPSKKHYPSRIIQGKKYKIFYNPMWKFFGDFDTIPGTYYYNNSDFINYYWHIFDQVIMSQTMVDKFEMVDILKKIGEISLIQGKYIKKSISDHLPIIFKLKEN